MTRSRNAFDRWEELHDSLVQEPVAFAEHLPVDVTDVVSRDVLPVFGELHAKPVVGTLMETSDIPFDDQPCPEVQAVDLIQGARFQVLSVVFHPLVTR